MVQSIREPEPPNDRAGGFAGGFATPLRDQSHPDEARVSKPQSPSVWTQKMATSWTQKEHELFVEALEKFKDAPPGTSHVTWEKALIA